MELFERHGYPLPARTFATPATSATSTVGDDGVGDVGNVDPGNDLGV